MVDEKITPTKAEPFVIKIFCADGDPNGLRIINKSNWSGQGLVCPRSMLPDYVKTNREYKFDNPGVYVLIGCTDEDTKDDEEDFEENDREKIYVGEADPVGYRLQQHCTGDKDFWTKCVFFVGDDINRAHIQHLEASLIELAQEAKKVDLDNGNMPTFPTLSLPEKAIANRFLAEMLSIFPLVGVDAFQKGEPPENLLYINTNGGIHASGYETPDGFVVLKGSTAVLQGNPATLNRLKKRLNKNGILNADKDHYEFTQDYSFRTPARAASVILGWPAARNQWTDKNGIAMGDVEKKIIVEKDFESENA
jgi:hypothetical protein